MLSSFSLGTLYCFGFISSRSLQHPLSVPLPDFFFALDSVSAAGKQPAFLYRSSDGGCAAERAAGIIYWGVWPSSLRLWMRLKNQPTVRSGSASQRVQIIYWVSRAESSFRCTSRVLFCEYRICKLIEKLLVCVVHNKLKNMNLMKKLKYVFYLIVCS